MPSVDTNNIRSHADAARQSLKRGDLPAAASACRKILTTDPRNPAGLFLSGVIALEQGQPQSAIRSLQEAVGADPENSAAFAQLARALVMSGRVDEALAAARSGLALAPDDSLTLDTLGVVFSHAGAHTDAAETFRRAVDRNPENTAYLTNLGISLKFSGLLDEARTAFEKALAIDPRQHRTRFALAHAGRYDRGNNHIAAIEAQLAGFDGPPESLMHLEYALAKERDDVGDYEQAFAALSRANRRWRTSHPYDIAGDEAIVTALIREFETGAASSPGYTTSEPVFVIGMPRTGTTLVERIVSSHSQVFSAGELPNIPQLAKRMSGTAGKNLLDEEVVRAMHDVPRAQFGELYVKSTRPRTGRLPHFIDKLPVNYLYAGLILQSLPLAKVVCLRRHPLDTCLSNFRQLFALDNPFYAYAYDLADCARYYVLFDRLMQHWHNVFAGRILSVDYEYIVANQESVSRSIIDFCELDWEPACLDFQDNAAPVATASSAQVREPIHSNAVARWKKYGELLEPAARILRAHGIPVD